MQKISEKIIRWLATTRLLTFPRRIIGRVINYAISSKNGIIIWYNDSERSKVLNLIKQVNGMRLNCNEAYQIFMAVKRTGKIDGDIAEVGTYKGGSAKLICEAKGNRVLHLFDTFEGLPELSQIDTQYKLWKGKYSASLEEVKKYLKQYQNVYFYKGIFPATAEHVKNKKFSFVHLDVDLYESTLACIKFFYPRMSLGGL